jgi:death-on-curing protein
VTLYLTLVEILDMHADQIRRYGGAPGGRDVGLVEAALFRPQIGHYRDLIEEASALWESLSQNHPFVDGNKRVASLPQRHFSVSMAWRSPQIPTPCMTN